MRQCFEYTQNLVRSHLRTRHQTISPSLRRQSNSFCTKDGSTGLDDDSWLAFFDTLQASRIDFVLPHSSPKQMHNMCSNTIP
jgi:hypothetical protein